MQKSWRPHKYKFIKQPLINNGMIINIKLPVINKWVAGRVIKYSQWSIFMFQIEIIEIGYEITRGYKNSKADVIIDIF